MNEEGTSSATLEQGATPDVPPTPPVKDDRVERALYDSVKNEAIDNRKKAKEANDKLAKLKEAFGITDDTSPEVLKTKVSEQKSELKKLKAENVVLQKAMDLNVSPKLTMALLMSEKVLDVLDVDSIDFATELTGEIKKLSETYPEIKVVKAPKKMGDGVAGSRPEGSKKTMNDWLRGQL